MHMSPVPLPPDQQPSPDDDPDTPPWLVAWNRTDVNLGTAMNLAQFKFVGGTAEAFNRFKSYDAAMSATDFKAWYDSLHPMEQLWSAHALNAGEMSKTGFLAAGGASEEEFRKYSANNDVLTKQEFEAWYQHVFYDACPPLVSRDPSKPPPWSRATGDRGGVFVAGIDEAAKLAAGRAKQELAAAVAAGDAAAVQKAQLNLADAEREAALQTQEARAMFDANPRLAYKLAVLKNPPASSARGVSARMEIARKARVSNRRVHKRTGPCAGTASPYVVQSWGNAGTRGSDPVRVPFYAVYSKVTQNQLPAVPFDGTQAPAAVPGSGAGTSSSLALAQASTDTSNGTPDNPVAR